MSMPRTEGWYDDPDGSDAERYFDGQQWTPRRRRKEPASNRPRSSDPLGSAPPPAGSSPYAYTAPVDPAIPYDAYAPPVSHGSSPPFPESHDSQGSVPQHGYQGPAQTGLRSTTVTGIQRTLSILLLASGIALIATSFVPWAQIREVDHSRGSLIATTVSFPGFGEPSVSATVSDGATSGTVIVPNSQLFQLRNTNPGWIAVLLGVAAVAAAAALLWVPQARSIVAISVAVLGGVAGLVCLIHLFDLRATFDNPPDLAANSFSPGLGLIAATVLSFFVTALGVWAYLAETRSSRSPY